MLHLVLYPDPFLRKRAAPVETIDDDLRARVQEMFGILYRERGIGLAAPQVGWGARLFVANATGEPDPTEERIYINPRILAAEGTQRGEEGCLSIPDVRGQVTRSQRVIVRAQGLDGRFFEAEETDLRARIVQHELDHLDGILFISKLSAADRFRVNRTLKRLEKEHSERTVRAR